MAYYKVRDRNTGLYMDKRYEWIFSRTGGLFGTLPNVRKKIETCNSHFSPERLQNDPNLIVPDLEIVQFNLVESNTVV